MTPIKIAALTMHSFILRNLHLNDLKIARTYAQLLSRSCNTCNMHPKYILDSASEFNGCNIGGR